MMNYSFHSRGLRAEAPGRATRERVRWREKRVNTPAQIFAVKRSADDKLNRLVVIACPRDTPVDTVYRVSRRRLHVRTSTENSEQETGAGCRRLKRNVVKQF